MHSRVGFQEDGRGSDFSSRLGPGKSPGPKPAAVTYLVGASRRRDTLKPQPAPAESGTLRQPVVLRFESSVELVQRRMLLRPAGSTLVATIATFRNGMQKAASF